MKTLKRQQLRQKAHNLLEKPGVYKMLDKEGHLLYIGKSRHLNKRVASYFVGTKNKSKKINRMIGQIADFEVYYTDTELDALLLECRWIQQQRPPYNTALTKTQKYRYFVFEEGEKCQLKVTPKPPQNTALCIGPMTSRKLSKNAYYFIERHYPEFLKRNNNFITLQREATRKKQLKDFIQEVLIEEELLREKLEARMKRCVDTWAYEEAAKIVDELKGLRYLCFIYHLTERALREDFIGILPIEGTYMSKYYLVRSGRIIKRLKGIQQEEKKILEFLKNYQTNTADWQKKIFFANEMDQLLILESFKNKRMRIIQV